MLNVTNAADSMDGKNRMGPPLCQITQKLVMAP